MSITPDYFWCDSCDFQTDELEIKTIHENQNLNHKMIRNFAEKNKDEDEDPEEAPHW